MLITVSPSTLAPFDGSPAVDVHPGRANQAGLPVMASWKAVEDVPVLLAAGLAVSVPRPDDERTVEKIVCHHRAAGRKSPGCRRALEHRQDTRLMLLAVGAAVDLPIAALSWHRTRHVVVG